LAFKGLAGAMLAFASIALAFFPHCAGVIASIVLSSLLLAIHRRHCPRHVGAFALVALVLLPLLLSRCCQHRELASAQSQSSRDTRWRHCQHRAIVVAGVVPTSLPSSRGCLCPCPAGVAALGIPVLPPAPQTGLWPVMMQPRHIAGEALLSRSLLLPVASLLYPALVHSNLAFDGLAKAAMAFFFLSFFGIALVSLPALHWCHCQNQAVLVPGIAPALLSSWPSKF
jgi:hypothetical protein